MSKIVMTNEIATAFCSSAADVNGLRSDAKGYLASRYGISAGDTEVNVIENTASCINVVLPYYSSLNNNSSAPITDCAMDGDGYGEAVVGAFGNSYGMRGSFWSDSMKRRHSKKTGHHHHDHATGGRK